jgi:hypothetical protein
MIYRIILRDARTLVLPDRNAANTGNRERRQDAGYFVKFKLVDICKSLQRVKRVDGGKRIKSTRQKKQEA